VAYVAVTVLGVSILLVAVFRGHMPEPAVPAFSETEPPGDAAPGFVEQAFDLIDLNTETLKDFLRMTVPLLRAKEDPLGLELTPQDLFTLLFRYLTGIRLGDMRSLVATQLPLLLISEGDPDPTSEDAELILPSPTDDIIVPNPEALSTPVDPEIAALMSARKPLVLIYHTHTQEAYLGPDYSRNALTYDDAFSADNAQNVVAVGVEFARVLQEEYGVGVIHVTEKYDARPGGGVTKIRAYVRSLDGVEPVVRANPEIRVIIDFHRDAFPPDTPVSTTLAAVPEEGEAARVLFVVGQGIPNKLEQPYWQHNLALATELSNWLEKYYPGLSRGVMKVRSRYNQHLAPGALLIEVGEVRNTMEQARASARILAHAVARQLLAGNIKTAAALNLGR